MLMPISLLRSIRPLLFTQFRLVTSRLGVTPNGPN
jgi:hypothetical protein